MRLLFLFALALNASAQVPAFIGAGTVGQRVAGFDATLSGASGGGSSGATIPTTNLVNWPLMVGVEGGIPARSTYITLGPTTTLAQANAHLAACPSNQQIALLSGTFDWTGGMVSNRNGVSVKGAGTNTYVKISQKMDVGTAFGTSGSAQGSNYVLSGYHIGSSNLVLSSLAPNIALGSMVVLSETNRTNYVHPWGYEDNMTAPAFQTGPTSPWGGERARGQCFRVNAKTDSATNSTLEVWPPVAGAGYDTSAMVHYTQSSGALNNVCRWGWSDLTITNTGGSTHFFDMDQCQNFWFTNINFHISAGDFAALYFKISHRATVVHCRFEGFNAAASAIVSQFDTGGLLAENNIFLRVNQAVVWNGRGGFSAALGNYSIATNGTTALISEWSTHGLHPQFILFEGNDFSKAQWDSIKGSASHITSLRNRGRATHSFTTSGQAAFAVDSWQYYMVFNGNELGRPGEQASGWTYELISTNTLVNIPLWRIGFSGYNPYVTGTNTLTYMTRHGNVDFIGSTTNVVWDASIASRTVESSAFYSAQPGYMGTLAWPAFGDAPYDGMTAAEYRLINGVDP